MAFKNRNRKLFGNTVLTDPSTLRAYNSCSAQTYLGGTRLKTDSDTWFESKPVGNRVSLQQYVCFQVSVGTFTSYFKTQRLQKSVKPNGRACERLVSIQLIHKLVEQLEVIMINNCQHLTSHFVKLCL